MTVFECLILISIYFLRFLLSFRVDWGDISNFWESVHHIFKHLKVRQPASLSAVRRFSTLFLVLVKQGLSCLIIILLFKFIKVRASCGNIELVPLLWGFIHMLLTSIHCTYKKQTSLICWGSGFKPWASCKKTSKFSFTTFVLYNKEWKQRKIFQPDFFEIYLVLNCNNLNTDGNSKLQVMMYY